MPNLLISEMSPLAAQAGLSLLLVEEVAADIFTGTFTGKWANAAAATSAVLDGTLYARYYDLPASQAWTGPPGRIERDRTSPTVGMRFLIAASRVDTIHKSKRSATLLGRVSSCGSRSFRALSHSRFNRLDGGRFNRLSRP